MFLAIYPILLLALLALNNLACADNLYDESTFLKEQSQHDEKQKVLLALNSTTGGPYTYSQSQHHFYGLGLF